MTSHRGPSGLILVLAVAAGTMFGVWLAIWLVRATGATPDRGRPSSEWRGPVDAESVPGIFQVAHAWAESSTPLRVTPQSGEAGSEAHPNSDLHLKVLLVALPNAGPRHRALLFIRPADAALCRALHGTELDTFWQGSQPVGVCSVADPARAELAALPVESRARRSS